MTPSETLQKRVDDCRERWKNEAKSVLAAYNVPMLSHDSACQVCPPIIGVLGELAEARERITSLERSDLAADLAIANAVLSLKDIRIAQLEALTAPLATTVTTGGSIPA